MNRPKNTSAVRRGLLLLLAEAESFERPASFVYSSQLTKDRVRGVEYLLDLALYHELDVPSVPASSPSEVASGNEAGRNAESLVWGAVHNAGRLGPRRPRWAAVKSALGVGSTSAVTLCLSHGLNPDVLVGSSASDSPESEPVDSDAHEDGPTPSQLVPSKGDVYEDESGRLVVRSVLVNVRRQGGIYERVPLVRWAKYASKARKVTP